MNICKSEDLRKLYGGATITGTVINGFVDLIRVLYDAGRGMGSAIRRIIEDDLCPLK